MKDILEALFYTSGTLAATAVFTRLYLEIIGLPVLTEQEWAVRRALEAQE